MTAALRQTLRPMCPKQQREAGLGLATVPGPAQVFLAAGPGLHILFHTLFPIAQQLLENTLTFQKACGITLT